MTFNREAFRNELRQLIDRHAGPFSSLKDYIDIFEELEREQERIGAAGDRAAGFVSEEMDDVGRH